MKICLLQHDIAWGDPQANCVHLDALLATAPQADLYVLPEMFSTGFATLPGAAVEHGEPCTGLAWMQRKAAALGAAIAGSIALEDGPSCVNRFYFDGQTMRQIMTEVGRWFSYDVAFANPEFLDERLHFSCSRSKSLSEVLQQLQLISGAKITVKDRVMTVF